ncbi:MAG: hypothetical protein WC740_09645 [Verrucomicrobiia bacterium]
MNIIMKTGASFAAWLSIQVLLSATVGAEPTRQWTSLFNGKDLSGWMVKCQTADKEKTFWTVTDPVRLHWPQGAQLRLARQQAGVWRF